MNASALARAREAVGRMVIQPASPFAVAEARIKKALGFATLAPLDLVAFWESRQPGSRMGDDRYRWEVSHKRCTPGAHVPPEAEWRPFRPDLPRDGDAELAISLPVSIAEQLSLLDALASGTEPGRARSLSILVEAEPLMRRDLAARIVGTSPWADTFALRCLVKHDRALARLGPLALAIATSYAAIADGGPVLGWRSPLYEKPLVSATAHLAAGLVRLGVELARLGTLARHVREAQLPSGGWGDPHGQDAKFGKEDLLTTLVSADLLACVDPTFDPEVALRWIASRQDASGFFVALGPELGWLTGEILDLAHTVTLPFARRFTFPHVAQVNLDRKTQLPFYAYFDDLARLFAELPGVSETMTEVAFVDLAGFGDFNNAHGQDMGDAVLGAFASVLAEVSGARAIRDGGDEFVVIGAPTRGGLARDLDAMRARWPAAWRARFPGAPVVPPRILVAATKSGRIRSCREDLGKQLGALKLRAKELPPEGVLATV